VDEMSWPTTHDGKAAHWIIPFNIHIYPAINKRLVNFLKQLYKPTIGWFPLLDMDEYIRFYLAKIQTRGNMKLQYEVGISQFALV